MALADGKIDVNGILHIKRGSNMKSCVCESNHLAACSDECSKFGEPAGSGPYTLELCQGRVLNFTNFTDERT